MSVHGLFLIGETLIINIILLNIIFIYL